MKLFTDKWAAVPLSFTPADPPTPTAEAAHEKNTGPQPRQSKPQVLKFLHPCPLCGDRSFVYGKDGGFFCTHCQPCPPGQLVEAGGQALQPQKAAGSLHDPPAPPSPGMGAGPFTRNHTPTEEQRANFRAAWPWLRAHEPALLAAGWTRCALYGRGKLTWPYLWGQAWTDTWQKPGLAVALEPGGIIRFTFTGTDKRRIITQRARPCAPPAPNRLAKPL